jgi:hypothetical protein
MLDTKTRTTQKIEKMSNTDPTKQTSAILYINFVNEKFTVGAIHKEAEACQLIFFSSFNTIKTIFVETSNLTKGNDY